MKEFFKKRPFAKIGLLGIPLLVFILIMETYYPKNAPDGFQSFILALEFVKTPEQIRLLFEGFSPQSIKDIDTGNYFDFGFMLSYSLFLFLFFKTAAKLFSKEWLKIGMILSVFVLLADVAENLCLFCITSIYSLEVNEFELIPLLKFLHVFTWFKWGGLTVIFLLYSIHLLGQNFYANVEGVVLIFPAILSMWALTNDPYGISNFTLSVILAFFMLIFYSFMHERNDEKMSEK